MDLLRIAKPGDPDLNYDVAQLKITDLIVVDQSFLIFLDHGEGWARWPDGSTTEATSIGQIAIRLNDDASDETGRALSCVLDRWYVQGVPLRMCAAPGRLSCLIASPREWIPLPPVHPILDA